MNGLSYGNKESGATQRIRPLSVGVLGCIIGIALLVRADDTPASYPPPGPFLEIENGMHTADIVRIAVDPRGRFLVTASHDKSARVWDLATGKLLEVLRPPQAGGFIGKLYAVAISPDASTVAVGGYTGPEAGRDSLYLFDRATGTLLRTIAGIANVILDLEYSPDGQYLAAALGDTGGLHIYRTSDLTEAARGLDYGDDSYSVDFDRSGRVVTTSWDGFVRLYGRNFKLIDKKRAPGGSQPVCARFSPDGKRIAVGFNDTSAVDVLSGEDLAVLSTLRAPQSGGSLNSVAWSRDGNTLYAAGHYASSSMREILSWSNAKGEPSHWPAAENTIMDLHPLSDGRLAFGATDPTVGLLNRQGQIIWQNKAAILDYRSPRGEVRPSADGSFVEFAFQTHSQHGWEKHLGRFNIPKREVTLEIPEKASLQPTKTTGLDIKDWGNTLHPTLNGNPIPIQSHEASRSLAVSGDNSSFLLGSEWYLQLFEANGTRRWRTPIAGVAWAVNLSANGQYALAALGDGTIRWYKTANGQEVMGLYVDPRTQRWVLWTPEGFYDSSPDADSLIGYHLNHGPDHEGEFVRVEQLKKLFYRPDLLAQRLSPGGDQLIQAELARIGDVSALLRSASAPELTSLSPAEAESDGSFTLQFRVASKPSGVGRIIYKVDGQEIEGRIVPPALTGPETVARQFDLPPGRHTLTASALDASNKLESRYISTVVNVKQPARQPSLYVIAVGISHYRDNSLSSGVAFAAADAQTIAAQLKRQGTGLFRDVIPKVLIDKDASLEGIQKAFADLAPQIQATDEFVFYLAGHGTAINGEYTFVPWNAIYSSSKALHDQSLTEERLQALLKTVQANKTLLLLDTCSAGSAIEARDPIVSEKGSIERLSKLTGRAILAASSSEKMAFEGYRERGVFTFAILEGLTNAADSQGLIQISTLADRVEERVPQITRERWGVEQFPMRLIEGQTFPIARKQP